MSRIRYWGERAYIHVYRRGFESTLLNQLASQPGKFYSLQELMDITLELGTSNDFATAVNIFALVCKLKTHSLPSPVCIPPIIPSPSLLPSRDDIFTEINNFGGIFAISLLHLPQDNMDLPALSFHASLEEQCDEKKEPEEIESVLNVVPPVYHQYFDLFYKVKAEKSPPHHSCDHHIELEGSLPPFGVIFSLSNNE
ncbi:hypothetical protein O181_019729 [Austropuccinia psidii MF-1]|uniref:Uncharacterized protein n=1 Tax=Austropuccinia psidii MF-1 TaxID=1389203 RepID=A0A9Q3C7M7_9BASI|nr:hypothetical protein [Austropuccinia psidii MF-1]